LIEEFNSTKKIIEKLKKSQSLLKSTVKQQRLSAENEGDDYFK
jgi:hypothetical protein